LPRGGAPPWCFHAAQLPAHQFMVCMTSSPHSARSDSVGGGCGACNGAATPGLQGVLTTHSHTACVCTCARCWRRVLLLPSQRTHVARATARSRCW
jgi:hypothetical protein